MMDSLLSIALGLGLSAACGFRVFVPFLVMSVAAKTGQLNLSGGFEWIGSDAALLTFCVATLLEVGAYYVPWIDNLLDGLATPTAMVAGVVATAASVQGTSELVTWTVAVIGGGGAAGAVQTLTTVGRGMSSLVTGGVGNPLFSTAEAGGAFAVSLLAVTLPVAALLAVAVGLGLGAHALRRRSAGPVRSGEAIQKS